MGRGLAVLLAFAFIEISDLVNGQTTRPHIIFIVADDLGWNDVGFHGSLQIPTPNIDALAYSGVILNNYYVQPICTPSRSAILSGMHPIHTGLQHGVIIASEPYGLPLNFKLLPAHLGSLGYTSHHVGKWHVGNFEKAYTPTFRGFLSHFGYWSGRIDYYDHSAFDRGWWGYDFRRNMEVDRKVYGNYTTDVLTNEAVTLIQNHDTSKPLFLYLAHLAVHSGNPYDPLQAPAHVVKRFSYIADENRRKFAGMLWKLDEGVGAVVKALQEREMLENSIIVFTSDNGGPAAGFNDNAASNWPLRGVKASMWEGGVRGAGLVWSPLLTNPGRISYQMMQVVDWLPTLYSAAGGDPSDLPAMDGMNQWESLLNDTPSPRKVILHNIDPIFDGAALREGDWKLLYNPSQEGPEWDMWFGPSGRLRNESLLSKSDLSKLQKMIRKSVAGKAILSQIPKFFKRIRKMRKEAEVLCGPVPENATKSCNSTENPCLFHIISDPCEYYDVSRDNPLKVKSLLKLLAKFNATAVPPGKKPKDPAANPVYWDYTWTNWQDYSRPIGVT